MRPWTGINARMYVPTYVYVLYIQTRLPGVYWCVCILMYMKEYNNMLVWNEGEKAKGVDDHARRASRRMRIRKGPLFHFISSICVRLRVYFDEEKKERIFL